MNNIEEKKLFDLNIKYILCEMNINFKWVMIMKLEKLRMNTVKK